MDKTNTFTVTADHCLDMSFGVHATLAAARAAWVASGKPIGGRRASVWITECDGEGETVRTITIVNDGREV